MGRWMHFWMAGLFFWMSASLAQDPSVVLPQGEIRGVSWFLDIFLSSSSFFFFFFLVDLSSFLRSF